MKFELWRQPNMMKCYPIITYTVTTLPSGINIHDETSCKAGPWFRRLLAHLSSLGPGFNPTPVRIMSMVDQVEMRQFVFLQIHLL
jgi:hypothetical protein